ncbi:MAG: hypothetical protein ABWK53_07360 [Anaerolineales bacterium]
MGRVIHTESAGKDRLRLTKGIALAVRQLAQQTAPGAEARDLAAFLVLALEAIAATIDESVTAWEKRGYWVKAERFRMDWDWAGQCARQMRAALLEDDWQAAAQTAAVIAQKVSRVNVPPGHRLGRPWEGAWNRFCKKYQVSKPRSP